MHFLRGVQSGDRATDLQLGRGVLSLPRVQHGDRAVEEVHDLRVRAAASAEGIGAFKDVPQDVIRRPGQEELDKVLLG